MSQKKHFERPPKILFILHQPPPIHGSSMVGQYIKDSNLINQTFECRYINLGTSSSVKEIGKKQFRKILRYLSILWQVIIYLIKFKPNLCYVAITAKGTAFYKDAFVALLVKVFRIKIVYHFHNKGVSTKQNKPLDNLLYRLVFNNSEVILLSKYLYPDIRKYINENQVYYCPNGIPKLNIQNYQPKTIKPAAEILFLSNLIESKGVYVLLEACKRLQKKKINFKCTLVGGIGDINEQQLNNKLQELDLTKAVFYAGKKFGEEKKLFFTNADIFIHPTLNDCFPLVLLEALQFSLPVISTYEGGIPDIVEDRVNGFLVPQKNAKALADKLEILIKDSELRYKMGKAGRKKYEKEFTLDIFENRLNQILTSIVTQEK